jgi:hypothetical protein
MRQQGVTAAFPDPATAIVGEGRLVAVAYGHVPDADRYGLRMLHTRRMVGFLRTIVPGLDVRAAHDLAYAASEYLAAPRFEALGTQPMSAATLL